MTKRYRSGYVRVKVDTADVLEQVDDEDLLEEVRERQLNVFREEPGDILEMFYAFKLGRDERAMELARKIAQDHTGRIL